MSHYPWRFLSDADPRVADAPEVDAETFPRSPAAGDVVRLIADRERGFVWPLEYVGD